MIRNMKNQNIWAAQTIVGPAYWSIWWMTSARAFLLLESFSLSAVAVGICERGISTCRRRLIQTFRVAKQMDSFSSPSGGSSPQFSAQDFKDQLKTQLAEAYAEEFLEVFLCFPPFYHPYALHCICTPLFFFTCGFWFPISSLFWILRTIACGFYFSFFPGTFSPFL